jgi:hypothetical protein
MQINFNRSQEYFDFLSHLPKPDSEETWPFMGDPTVYKNFNNLSSLSNFRKREVLNTYKPSSVEMISEEHDLVSIIPFRYRYLHLEKSIESLLKSYESAKFSLAILVVENSQKSIASDICSRFKNVYYRWLDSGGKLFNKCICHNIGEGITKSKFLHFHDCDLLVSSDFYKELYETLLITEIVQAFSKRRVNYIDESNTRRLIDGDSLESVIKNSGNFRPGKLGAPGGSVAISRSLFKRVGGFDSQLFWEYAPEDAFFWAKVEKFQNIVGLNNPPVELYHLWHISQYGKNPHKVFDKSVLDIFINNPDFHDFIETSKNIYKEINEYIIK